MFVVHTCGLVQNPSLRNLQLSNVQPDVRVAVQECNEGNPKQQSKDIGDLVARPNPGNPTRAINRQTHRCTKTPHPKQNTVYDPILTSAHRQTTRILEQHHEVMIPQQTSI